MGVIVQVVATGVAIGSVYGLLAICFALIYRLTGVVHFALGELAGLAAFVTILIAQGTGVTSGNVSVPRWLTGALVAVVIGAALGGAVYLTGVKPFLGRSSPVGWIGGTIAAAVLLRGVVAAVFTGPSYLFRDPIPFERLSQGGVISLGGGASISVRTLFVAAAGLLLAFLTARLLDSTRVGRGLRAVTQNRTAAALVGVPIERFLGIAFVAVGAIAAIAAVIALPSSPISGDTGTLLGLKALVAAAAARFKLPRPVFVAGIVLGVLETAIANFHLGGFSSGASFRNIVPFALLIALLAARSLRAPERQVA